MKKRYIVARTDGFEALIADFKTGQVTLCACDRYCDNYISIKQFLRFAKRLEKAMEEQK